MFGFSERFVRLGIMDFLFVKVLLYAYPKLRAVAEAVSVGIENKAALSFRSSDSALTVAEKIMGEIVLRENIDCAADAIDKVLDALSEDELYCLEYKYFRRKRVLKERFGSFVPACSERNYYRKQAELLKRVFFLLTVQGWTETRFFEAFGEFGFFMKLYRALAGGKERALTQKRARRTINFQNSGCSSPCETGGFLPRSTKNATATAAAQTMQMTAIWTPERPSPEEEGFPSSVPAEVGVR